MNPATFLTVSLVILAPAAAFILDHQIIYQQSMEELSAEQNAIDNAPRRHEVKKNLEPPPRSSSYEDSSELIPNLPQSEFLDRIPLQESESEESDAIWHRTCGIKLTPRRRAESASRRSAGRRLLHGVRTVWRQLNITMLQYRARRYQRLYAGVDRGIEERQYIPTWIPDRGDAVALSEMNVQSREHLTFALESFNSGLQKFAVAYEQMIADEDDPEREAALKSTQSSIRELLCEIDSAMVAQGWSIPPRVPRSIMTPEERSTPDFTRRMLRDWGVLLRYGTFLHAWGSMMSRLYPAIITIHELTRANMFP